jgi:hypothetical protein
MRNAYKNLGWEALGRGQSEDLDVDGRIILESILGT